MTNSLSLECHPSHIHFVVIFFVHLLALLALGLVEESLWIPLLAFFILISAIYYVLKVRHKLGNNITSLHVEIDGNKLNWSLGFQDGEERKVQLKTGARVFPWLISCQFFDQSAQYPLVLFSDSTGLDEHRQLRVFLSLYNLRS